MPILSSQYTMTNSFLDSRLSLKLRASCILQAEGSLVRLDGLKAYSNFADIKLPLEEAVTFSFSNLAECTPMMATGSPS